MSGKAKPLNESPR